MTTTILKGWNGIKGEVEVGSRVLHFDQVKEPGLELLMGD